MKIRCNGCGYIGERSEFPTGRDFFQHAFIASCPKCDNRQSPGGSSMQMFSKTEPFSVVPDGTGAEKL